jgi:hypothetical protein
MSLSKGMTCRHCGEKYHHCSSCGTGETDYTWFYCSDTCYMKKLNEHDIKLQELIDRIPEELRNEFIAWADDVPSLILEHIVPIAMEKRLGLYGLMIQ